MPDPVIYKKFSQFAQTATLAGLRLVGYNSNGNAQAVPADLFATKAQGEIAETALQPSDVGSAAYAESSDFATAAQGSLADSALQGGDVADVAISGLASDVESATTGLDADNVNDALQELADTRSAQVGTLPLTFDIDRNYGTEASPITGDLGWTASANDKPVSHIVIHQDSAPPAELANMHNIGVNTYINGVKNMICITCVLPNVTYIYTIGYLP